MGGSRAFVAIELTSREGYQVRGVEAGVLGVDRNEHLDDVIFGEPVEDHGRYGERLLTEAVDVGVQGEEAVLAVDGAQDPLSLRHFQAADRTAILDRFEPDDAALTALARERARSVQDALLANTELNPERVFMTSERSGAAGEREKVRMEMKLE